MTGADVCTADVVLREEHVEELVAAVRAAVAAGKGVRLLADTTGLEGPCITVWSGLDECVAEVPVAGVVFE